MNSKKFISGISAFAIAASAFAGLAVTAGATVYDAASVDLSKFDNYGTYDSETGVETLSLGSSKQWAKLDLTPYTKKDGESTTKVTVSYTETLSSTGRTAIGFYDADKAVYSTANAWQDTEGAPIVYGITSGSSPKRYYINGAEVSRAASFSTDAAEDVTLTFDLTTGTVSGSIGSQSVSGTFDNADSIDTLGIYSWSATTYEISNMTIAIETTTNPAAGALTVNYVDSADTSVVIDSQTPDVSSYFATDSYTYYYPAYIAYNGAYYKADTTAYGAETTLTEAAKTETVSYTKVEDKTIVAFIEGETSTAVKNDATGYGVATEINTRYSAGKAMTTQGTGSYLSVDVEIPADGNYTFEGPLYNSNAKSRTVDLYIDDISTEMVGQVAVAANGSSSFSVSADLTAGTHTFIFSCNYSLTPAFDYVLVTQNSIAAPTTYSNGYAFTSTIDEAKEKSLFVTATKGEVTDTASIALADKLAGFTGEASVSLTVLLTNIPEDITVDSVVIK
ncbi:MAG: carbohydrate-binding protein [Candidatus Ornithomonoglobus sp.]